MCLKAWPLYPGGALPCNPTIQIRAVPSLAVIFCVGALGTCRNPTIQIRAVPRENRPDATSFPLKTCRNPTIQIRAVPRKHEAIHPGRTPVPQGSSEVPAQPGHVGSQLRRNPTIQIRAVPSEDGNAAMEQRALASQSHNTDQGSSEDEPPAGGGLSRDRKSQSHNTDQGSSETAAISGLGKALWASQSHNTDQGSSECGLSNPLQMLELRGLFFQPRRRRLFSSMMVLSCRRSNRRKWLIP